MPEQARMRSSDIVRQTMMPRTRCPVVSLLDLQLEHDEVPSGIFGKDVNATTAAGGILKATDVFVLEQRQTGLDDVEVVGKVALQVLLECELTRPCNRRIGRRARIVVIIHKSDSSTTSARNLHLVWTMDRRRVLARLVQSVFARPHTKEQVVGRIDVYSFSLAG
jgi:hypothetical protein